MSHYGRGMKEDRPITKDDSGQTSVRSIFSRPLPPTRSQTLQRGHIQNQYGRLESWWRTATIESVWIINSYSLLAT
jgi:hypothetical protein